MAEFTGTTSANESRRHFRKRVRKALNDPSLQRALRQAMTGLRERRNRGFQSYDFQTGRADLKQRRLANLNRLPELLEEFKQRLEEVDGRFHYARDAEEARRIIGEICTRAGAGIVTKSKSMATEEILLNPYLESLGMEVVETDLGERMVQLTHSHPSHIIAPAIHLTKEDAAAVFGVEPTIKAIQDEARRSLREKFINASVGISGANAAIAETGTVMIVTNEGNADLTVTLPPVHIALFGIDKIVATLDDATSMLRMLPRSGTGQRMSAYVNFVTGPSRSGDIEQSLAIGVHGPGEMHCVVLDNGRTEMRADPIMREAMTCIRCGACSNACPPFMAVGGHQFGHIYNGPIGLVLTPFHHGHKVDDFPNSLCVQCNACQEICPVDIPLPRQILEHRRSARKPIWKTAMLDLWASTLVDPALRLAAPFSGLVPGAPAALATKPYRDRVQPTPPGDSLGPTATIFASCLVDRILPGEGEALERILKAAGYRVAFPEDQWCCGLICANAGKFELGAKLSRQLHTALEGSLGPIITPSASCFGAFTMDAAEWGVDTEGREAVASRMRDSTRFVLELLEERPDLVSRDLPRTRIAYHDSCQSLRQLGLKAEPRRVLELAGYEVVELPDIANCCGFGGTFSIEWPEVASRILDWKLEAVEKTGSAILASDNPGCLMHIGGGASNRGLDLRVAHVLELVAERLA
jgi:L-lactate dehydrogenase complex protein LldF